MKKVVFLIAMTIATSFLIVAVSCKKDEGPQSYSDYELLPTFEYNGIKYRVATCTKVYLNYDAAIDYCNQYSVSGIRGWMIPTRGQLVEMYNQREKIGGISVGMYWSSTVNSDGEVFTLYVGSEDHPYDCEYYDTASKRCLVWPIHME
ncbi:MAG: hypothetical protein K5867_01750 [Bacteroidales bacterium]|nr:hypothetical protein [Bacteroidales bacterium]